MGKMRNNVLVGEIKSCLPACQLMRSQNWQLGNESESKRNLWSKQHLGPDLCKRRQAGMKNNPGKTSECGG